MFRVYKIYKILDLTNGNCYIGSTGQKYLSKRISRHRDASNTCSSKQIIDNGDYEVSIVEQFEDQTLKLIKERYWINNTDNCINKNKLNGVDKEKQKIIAKDKYQYQKTWGDLKHTNCDLF